MYVYLLYYMCSSPNTGACTVYGIRLIQIILSVLLDDVTRRKIRLIEGNAKCRHLKVTLAEGVF